MGFWNVFCESEKYEFGENMPLLLPCPRMVVITDHGPHLVVLIWEGAAAGGGLKTDPWWPVCVSVPSSFSPFGKKGKLPTF